MSHSCRHTCGSQSSRWCNCRSTAHVPCGDLPVPPAAAVVAAAGCAVTWRVRLLLSTGDHPTATLHHHRSLASPRRNHCRTESRAPARHGGNPPSTGRSAMRKICNGKHLACCLPPRATADHFKRPAVGARHRGCVGWNASSAVTFSHTGSKAQDVVYFLLRIATA
jgi:hypothetical protein